MIQVAPILGWRILLAMRRKKSLGGTLLWGLLREKAKVLRVKPWVGKGEIFQKLEAKFDIGKESVLNIFLKKWRGLITWKLEHWRRGNMKEEGPKFD